MREAEECKGFRFSLTALLPNPFAMFPEFDQPRLFRM
jgi:hypothetical protein